MLARSGEQYRSYQSREPMLFPGRGRWGQLIKRSPGSCNDEGREESS
jgi:hypothetical protein